MVYIPDGSKFSPGTFLGDAKTLETRGVPYDLRSDGEPLHDFAPGDVVWINVLGFAVPYDRNSLATLVAGTPYGVVTNVNHVKPKGPKCSADSNSVTIATEGIVAVTYKPKYNNPDTTPIPKLGEPVNQYGCKAGEGDSAVPNEYIIGICEGVGTDPDPENDDRTVVAVRLTAGASATTGYYGQTTQVKARCANDTAVAGKNDDDDGTIPAYAPVRLVPSFTSDGVPLIKQWTSEAQELYGYAAEPIPPGETGYVVTKGMIELPYVYPETVADKNAMSRGYQVAWIQREHPNGTPVWEKVLIYVRDFAVTAGVLLGAVCGIYKAKQSMNSGGKAGSDSNNHQSRGKVGSGSNGQGRILGKTTKNGVGDEPVIDGWLTVDVDPQVAHTPMSLDYAVAADESTQLIPGHVYGGSDSGVMEYQTNWDGYPFVGVCTGLDNEEGKTPILREGSVDVIAADNWAAGDYIDYTRHSIPEAYEPYTPHIGVAVADTAEGELGAVHLQPWDPNEYIVLDHVKLMGEPLPLNTSVYLSNAQIYGCTQVVPIQYPDGNYPSLMGILRRGITNYVEDPVGFTDRAIIQTGGYVWTEISPDVNLFEYIGKPVRALGEDWMDKIPTAQVGENRAFIQLGTIVSTFSNAESSADTIMVKLDIKHHPKIPIVTGREDVRLDIKKVIPLTIWSSDNKMHVVNDNDRYFTIEGLDSEVYTDPVWRDEFIDNFTATAITPSAAGLTFEGTHRGIISSFALESLTSNQVRMTVTGDVPDQWDDDDYRVLGYQFKMRSALTGNEVIVSTPVYFIMNSENARKPIESPEVKPEIANSEVAETKTKTTKKTAAKTATEN